jgi:hypothetical protein
MPRADAQPVSYFPQAQGQARGAAQQQDAPDTEYNYPAYWYGR